MKWMWRNIREQEETGDVMLYILNIATQNIFTYKQTDISSLLENEEEYMGGSFRFRFSHTRDIRRSKRRNHTQQI